MTKRPDYFYTALSKSTKNDEKEKMLLTLSENNVIIPMLPLLRLEIQLI